MLEWFSNGLSGVWSLDGYYTINIEGKCVLFKHGTIVNIYRDVEEAKAAVEEVYRPHSVRRLYVFNPRSGLESVLVGQIIFLRRFHTVNFEWAVILHRTDTGKVPRRRLVCLGRVFSAGEICLP